jgi:hypothetical protein
VMVKTNLHFIYWSIEIKEMEKEKNAYHYAMQLYQLQVWRGSIVMFMTGI